MFDAEEIQTTNTISVPLLELPRGRSELGDIYLLPRFHANVSSHSNLLVVLDSGCTYSAVSYSLARDYRVPTIAGCQPIPIAGSGGVVTGYWGLVSIFTSAALEVRRLPVVVVPDASAFWGEHGVLLSVNAFRKLSYLTIDNLNRTLTISPKEDFKPDVNARFSVNTPLWWRDNRPMIDVKIDGKRFACLIDTGNAFGVTIPQKHALQLGYWKPGQASAPLLGVAGLTTISRYTVQSFQVGDFNFERMPGFTETSDPGMEKDEVKLGNGILHQHRVTFDFKQHLLWLEH